MRLDRISIAGFVLLVGGGFWWWQMQSLSARPYRDDAACGSYRFRGTRFADVAAIYNSCRENGVKLRVLGRAADLELTGSFFLNDLGTLLTYFASLDLKVSWSGNVVSVHAQEDQD